MELSGERCVACRPGSPMLTIEDEAILLPRIPHWEVVETNGVRKLRRTFRFDGWMPAVRYVDEVAMAAEADDHHPTVTLSWGKVTVTWWTHAIGGLHRNDVIMAARCDSLFDGEESGAD